jgi:sarcosine oxidase / L-pipecolate oxidase
MAARSSPQTGSKAPSTLILGAGVFGASTAYHLAKKYPDAEITLLDRSTGVCQSGASWDWNKIIRADYEDPFYMRLALEAMDLWSNDPLFSPFFRPTGAAWLMPDSDYPERVARNYRALGKQPDFEIITAEEMKTRYDGLFKGTDMSGVSNIFLNKSSGVAQAKDALAALITKAVGLGVRNVALDVKRLIIDSEGICVGIEGYSGEQIKADRVIVSTGAYTPKLLADSVPLQKESQIRNFIAAASLVGIMKLDPENLAKFNKSPVFIHNISKVPGMPYA